MTQLAFNEQFYLSQNPDVVIAIARGQFANAKAHFDRFGATEGRDPNQFFDTSFYLSQYPDVLNARVNPLDHFLQFGAREGRFANATIDAAVDSDNNNLANEFNADAYLAANPDLAGAIGPGKAFATPFQHFTLFGQFESRPGTPAGGPFTNTGQAPNAGQTFTLTTGADNLVGSNANDTFNAVTGGTEATFGVADIINGGAGTDSLKITSAAASGSAIPVGASITNVENFFIRNVGGSTTTDFAAIDGEQQVWNDRSAVAGGAVVVTGLASGTVVGVQGNGSINVSATTATYVDAATAASVLVSGGTGSTTGAVTVNGAGLTSATITGQSGANTLGGVTVAGTVKAVNVVANSELTTGSITGVAADSTLSISGAAKANVGTLATNFTTVDASKNAGGVTITLDGDTNTKFTGGTGADTVTLGANALTTGSVDGGAGVDTLVATATNLNSAATGAKYTNFEILRSAAGTINVENVSGITGIELAGGSVANLSSAQASAIKVLASGTYDIGVKNASTVGQIDTVALTIDDGIAAKNTLTLTTPTLTGVENLSINAIDNVVVTGLANALALNKVTLTGAGDQQITVGTVNLAANSTIDGSASTGKLTIDASGAQAAASATGLAITGGAANDTISGSQKADIITGGAGNDILFGRGGADTIIGGDGNDIIQGDGTGSGVVTPATFETFKATFGATVDADTVAFDGVTEALTAGQTGIQNAQEFTTAYNAAGGRTFNAVANGDGTVTFTSIASGDRTDVTSASFVVTGGGSGTDISVTAAAPIVQGAAAVSGITLGTDLAGADILTGGAGNDNFRFAAGSSNATVTDTITDLNLGSNVEGGRVDILTFQNTGATATVVTLTSGQQATVTAQTSLAAAAGQVANAAQTDGATVQFTFANETYIFHNGDGNGTFDDAADFLVKVTGVTGTLDASDIVLV